ncbi:B12-binding domain-containing radical SAM protein [Candidatus Margulisiibacteriota bacterium]
MKILLVRPFIVPTEGISPPLSLLYLSSYLKDNNNQLEVSIIDSCIDKTLLKEISMDSVPIKNLIRDIKKLDPDIIGMTLFSSELNEISLLCRLMKRELSDCLIVLGGPHPTAMPEKTLELIPECDFVIRGEGEIIFHDLINNLIHKDAIRKVKGLSYRRDNIICSNDDADIIANLDNIPFPDRRSLLYNYKNGTYGSFLFGSPIDIIITSRGCPFQCSYCFKVCPKYRSRSIKNVIDEIDWIVKNIAPEYIYIMDDSFTAQRERCVKILDALIEKKYGCNFRVRSRVDAVSKELLDKMKKAGVDIIVYGLESGSQKMLDAFNKRTTVAQNIAACRLTRQAGINCFADMILFYPGESKETLKETKRFIKIARPILVQFHILTPLPKTKIYEEARRNGTLVGDWGTLNQTPWIKTEEFNDLKIMEAISRKLLLKTLLTPHRIWWAMRYFGKRLLRNPSTFLKMIIYNFMIKRKY